MIDKKESAVFHIESLVCGRHCEWISYRYNLVRKSKDKEEEIVRITYKGFEGRYITSESSLCALDS